MTMNMNQRVLLLPYAATLLALASGQALACGHDHKSWPKGAVICMSHHQFECQDMGAWHKLPGRCEADTPPPGAQVTEPANKTPASGQDKVPPAPQKPTSNSK